MQFSLSYTKVWYCVYKLGSFKIKFFYLFYTAAKYFPMFLNFHFHLRYLLKNCFLSENSLIFSNIINQLPKPFLVLESNAHPSNQILWICLYSWNTEFGIVVNKAKYANFEMAKVFSCHSLMSLTMLLIVSRKFKSSWNIFVMEKMYTWSCYGLFSQVNIFHSTGSQVLHFSVRLFLHVRKTWKNYQWN